MEEIFVDQTLSTVHSFAFLFYVPISIFQGITEPVRPSTECPFHFFWFRVFLSSQMQFDDNASELISSASATRRPFRTRRKGRGADVTAKQSFSHRRRHSTSRPCCCCCCDSVTERTNAAVQWRQKSCLPICPDSISPGRAEMANRICLRHGPKRTMRGWKDAKSELKWTISTSQQVCYKRTSALNCLVSYRINSPRASWNGVKRSHLCFTEGSWYCSWLSMGKHFPRARSLQAGEDAILS